MEGPNDFTFYIIPQKCNSKKVLRIGFVRAEEPSPGHSASSGDRQNISTTPPHIKSVFYSFSPQFLPPWVQVNYLGSLPDAATILIYI